MHNPPPAHLLTPCERHVSCWEEAILSSRHGRVTAILAALFLLFSHCFLPLLFISRTTSSSASTSPSLPSPPCKPTLQLMKQLLFNLVWDEDTERRRGGQYDDYMRVPVD